ncbi:sensor histidine kinase [Chitinophaga sp. sic0106]|uniref:sensor histidine kinase n=1 Tax=Chitinophaga sp. sic0106 TaxID=2854785 RepID=UPI001C448C51|nr:histidine kinase [Chitinophaga sp. sic0106]MBV7529108.1 histidine kinase [Chitinophaga sp. sic0106]
MKQGWYNNKWAIIAMHIFAWLLLFMLPRLLKPSYEDPKPSPDHDAWTIFSFIYFMALIGFFYLNALVYIPSFVYKKRYLEYAASILTVLLALYSLRYAFEMVFTQAHKVDVKPAFLFTFFTAFFILSTSTAFQMIRDRLREERLASEKVNENLQTELSLLRSQVSPHFMFNVLNNMVALARKKSDALEPSLIKLSSLMRYMIYETDEQQVELAKEIDYLQSYIDLQQQRFGKNVTISSKLNAPETGYQIEPMLLIPFVENAFKHGTGMIQDALIAINLEVQENVLYFTVRNKYMDLPQEIKDKTSGIGLVNVSRRLNLLYNQQYKLDIRKQDGWFSVLLQLNLH